MRWRVFGETRIHAEGVKGNSLGLRPRSSYIYLFCAEGAKCDFRTIDLNLKIRHRTVLAHPAPLLLCQIFFFAVFFRRLTPRRGGSFFGSPVAAFFTTPPSSSAISVSVRLVRTEYGWVSVISSLSIAYLSRCFIKSHCRSRVRTSTKEPFSF